MKKIKILIIITSIISLILIFSIIIIKLYSNNNEIENNNVINNQITNNNVNYIHENQTIQNNIPNNETIRLNSVKDRDKFFTVKSCVEKYISYIVDKDNYAVYRVLNEYYINKNNIDVNNISAKIQPIEKQQIFTAEEMKYAKKEEIEIYTVYGKIREDLLNERGQEYNFNLTVILNTENKTFSIIPQIINVEEINLIEDSNINSYNEYTENEIDIETMANIYFVTYKSEILNNIENAYNLLETEYSYKRFSDYTKFSQYINNNIEEIKKAKLVKYTISNYDNYTIYECIDQYNNYYIFEERAIMKYEVMLDDYTIDTEKFVETYNNSSLEEKVELNIKKVIKMINNKDYESAYNILNSGFKQNYFPTLNDFENYVVNTFYQFNDVTFNSFSTEGDIGIYEVNINGIENNVSATKQKTIIMKLGTGTDFEISFDI